MENLSNIISRVKSYEPLWNGWHCTEDLLGSGGSGCVLLLNRGEERSVVKVICIDNDPVKYDMVKNEIETMLSLSGDYLVECLDYRIEQVFNSRGECSGFDFLIQILPIRTAFPRINLVIQPIQFRMMLMHPGL